MDEQLKNRLITVLYNAGYGILDQEKIIRAIEPDIVEELRLREEL
jgi:hypothetical protein